MGKKHYNKIPTPKPLQLVKYLNDKYPGMWESYDKHAALYQSLMGAEYVSRKVCSNIAQEFIQQYTPMVDGNKSADAHTVYAIGAWRHYKEIYSIDKDLGDMLISAADDISIPTDILKTVPYTAFYVEIENTDAYKENGFFFVLNTHKNEVDFVTIDYDGNVIAMPLLLDSQYTIEEMINASVGDGNPYYNMTEHKRNILFVKRAMQLVLYICAINSDIQENPQQSMITKKSTKNTKPKDTLKEVRKWDVGYRVGTTIRIARNKKPYIKETDGVSHAGSAKRPHVRRGHFHHFWTGSIANNTRKLVLKWVAPSFINSTIDGDTPATINNIKE